MIPRATRALSTFLVGATRAEERAFGGLLGGSPARFLALAQRCVWGLTQPDIVRVNLDKSRTALTREFPRLLPAHLFDAYVLAGTGRNEEAERALATARGMAHDSPFAALCPTQAEWAAEVPPSEPVEVVPDRLWRLETLFPATNTRFLLSSVLTVVRCESGELVLINPGAISDANAERLRALGPVRWVVNPSRAHKKYIAAATARFPEAQHLGVPDHLTSPNTRHVALRVIPGDGQLPAELEIATLRGSVMPDVQLFHRPTRSLIAVHLPRLNPAARDASFHERLYSFAWGVYDRTAWLGYQPVFWRDLAAVQASLHPVLGWNFERVFAAHGSVAGPSADGVAAFRDSIRWTVTLPRKAHNRMVREYWWQQPRFLLDMIRHKLPTRG